MRPPIRVRVRVRVRVRFMVMVRLRLRLSLESYVRPRRCLIKLVIPSCHPLHHWREATALGQPPSS